MTFEVIQNEELGKMMDTKTNICKLMIIKKFGMF